MTDWRVCEAENSPGKAECPHVWGSGIFSIDTFPPLLHRRCELCNRIEAKEEGQ